MNTAERRLLFTIESDDQFPNSVYTRQLHFTDARHDRRRRRRDENADEAVEES